MVAVAPAPACDVSWRRRLRRHAPSSPPLPFPPLRSTERWLLPGNASKFEKDLLAALHVLPSSAVKGKRVIDSGLRDNGLRVEAILQRGGNLIRRALCGVVLAAPAVFVVDGFQGCSYFC